MFIFWNKVNFSEFNINLDEDDLQRTYTHSTSRINLMGSRKFEKGSREYNVYDLNL